MVKDAQTVIQEFNEIVNMTPDELEQWLKCDDSRSAGWPKDDGDGGESVGHDSGRKIAEILRANPDGAPDGYSDEQVDHMRKVVSYCKRHLAQEEKTNDQKPAEEVKQTKSYASLKNWGHDPLKKRGEGGAENEENEENEGGDKQAGDKRKKSEGAQGGANKKRETRQGKGQTKEEDAGEEEDEEEEAEEEEADEDDGQEKKALNGPKKQSQGQANQKNGSKKKQQDDKDQDDQEEQGGSDGKTPKKGPNKGETVSWNWGNGNPEGKVLDVKAEKTSIETKNGNEVSRDGDPEDPAVVLDTGKSKAIKSNHELN